MDVRIQPAPLGGTINAIASKSDAHRALICAALSDAPTAIRLRGCSQDILATIQCLQSLGAGIQLGECIDVQPLWVNRQVNANLHCGESGSTLRFLLPLAAALGGGCTLQAGGRLPDRPIAPLLDTLAEHGCQVHAASFPLSVGGKLTSGLYTLAGHISSQFISGLLFALPLLDGDSEIRLITPLESAAYVEMTIRTLSHFGVRVDQTQDGYRIAGGQRYISPGEITVEGDWSNAAFFLSAGALSALPLSCAGLDEDSPQADRAILPILRAMGAAIDCRDGLHTVWPSPLRAVEWDISQTPDLMPVAAVLMAGATGTSVIRNAARLRLKESDRLSAMAQNLQALGCAVKEYPDALRIGGQPHWAGGIVQGCNDHRIVMAMAVASMRCQGDLVIKGAQAVNKSNPSFFEDFKQLGGNAVVI